MKKSIKNVVTEQGFALPEESVKSLVRYDGITTSDPIVGEILVMREPYYRLKNGKPTTEVAGFIFDSNKRAPVRMTLRDIRRFDGPDGKPVLDSFRFQEGKLFVRKQFTVKGTAPYTTRFSDTMYPLYCYEATDEVVEARGEGNDLTSSDYNEIYKSDPKDEYLDLFYRRIVTKEPILYYPEAGKVVKTPRKRKTPAKPATK